MSIFQKKPDELDLSEVTARLGVTRQAVQKYITNGSLKGERRGKAWYVKITDFQQFLDSQINRNY